MEKQDVARYTSIDSDLLNRLKVVGHCQIGNDSYPIVEVASNLESLTEPKKFSAYCNQINSPQIEISQRLFQFEMDGKILAIVEAKILLNANLNITSFLTEREIQVATLVARGKSNKQIAIQLGISEWTVSTHLRRIFVKFNVDTRAAMVYHCADFL